MARSTVEIIGGQLDGSVLENAASESTLREIVNAINGSTGNNQQSGAAARNRGAILERSFNGAVKQLGNVAGTAGAFAGMLVSGQGKISAYTKTLNEQVIKQLPLFGKTLGAVGSTITGAVEEVERWNDTLVGLTKTGATFNNSIIQMMNASVRTYMTLDEFSAIIAQNSQKFISFGGTVTRGVQAFSDFSHDILSAGGAARDTLVQMGYSTTRINQSLINYLDNVYRGTNLESVNRQQLSESFVNYQVHLHRLTSITGKQIDEIEKDMAVTAQDSVYRLQVNRIQDAATRDRLNMMLTSFTAILGEGGAEMFRSAYMNLAPIGPAAESLYFSMPGLFNQIREMQNQALNFNGTEEEFNELVRRNEARIIMSAAQSYGSLEHLFEAIAAGDSRLQGLAQGMEPVIGLLARMGVNIDTLTEDQILAAMDQARAETNSRESITRLLRDFEFAIRDFKVGFMEVLTGPTGALQTFSNGIEELDLGEMAMEAGRAVGDFVRTYLPAAIDFFNKFGTPAGRDLLKEELSYMLESIGIRLSYYIPRMFSDSEAFSDANLQAELERLEARYSGTLGLLGSRHAAELADRAATRAAAQGSTARAEPFQGNAAEFYRAMYQAVYDQAVAAGLPNPEAIAHLGASQSAQETGFGRSLAGGNNYFGIKGVGPAGSSTLMTNEYVNGQLVRIPQEFRNYNNMAESAADYIAFLQRYARYRPVLEAQTPEGAIAAQGRSGYATDPNYGAALMNLYQRGRSAMETAQGVPRTGNSAGTLGTYGRLFADFGEGTQVDLHGEEAVITPEQMTGILNSGNDGSLRNEIESLNQQLSMLVRLTQKRLDLSSRSVSEQKRSSGNLFAAVS